VGGSADLASHRLPQPLLQLAISAIIIPPARVFVNHKSNKINVLKSSKRSQVIVIWAERDAVFCCFSACYSKSLILLGYKVFLLSPKKIFT